MQSGQAGAGMSNSLNSLGRPRALSMFADWTDRIAARRDSAGAAAAAGSGAQRRHHHVGLGRPQGVPARRRRDRPAKSDGQCERAAVRCARAERRLPAGARSEEQHDQPRAADRARSEHAGHLAQHAAAVALLGRRSDLDEQEQRPQPDARREGPRLDHVRGPSGGEPGLLQGRVEPSVGEAVPRSPTRGVTWRCTTRRRRS